MDSPTRITIRGAADCPSRQKTLPIERFESFELRRQRGGLQCAQRKRVARAIDDRCDLRHVACVTRQDRAATSSGQCFASAKAERTDVAKTAGNLVGHAQSGNLARVFDQDPVSFGTDFQNRQGSLLGVRKDGIR